MRTAARFTRMIIRNLAGLALAILVLPTVAQGQAQKSEDQELKVFKGQPASVDFSVPKNREYRTRLREASLQPANFAGHYVFTSWGCGTRCMTGAAVNLISGEVTFLPFTTCCWPESDRPGPFNFKPTRDDFIVEGQLDEKGQNTIHVFKMTAGKFESRGTLVSSILGGAIAAAVQGKLAREASERAANEPPANPVVTAQAQTAIAGSRNNGKLVSEDRLFTLSVCNKYKTSADFIVFHKHSYDDSKWILEGWWKVDVSACKTVRIPRGYFYISANGADGTIWTAKDRYLCIMNRVVERVVFENERCLVGETNRGFHEVFNTNDTFTYNLNP
ncbi:DUF1036 domain-containing protein [Tardiphaga sp. P5_C7]